MNRTFHHWRSCLAIILVALAISPALAKSKSIALNIAASDEPRTNVPLTVNISLPAELAEISLAKVKVADQELWGQLTAPSLLSDAKPGADGEVVRELHFVVPKIDKGAALEIEAQIDDSLQAPAGFAWQAEGDKQIDLLFADALVARYMCEPFTTTSAADRARTYKVFHHVFNPLDNTRLTKGMGSQFTHHRGVYYGFSKCSYGDGKKADTWHCPGEVHQSHGKVLAEEAGPVLARQRLLVNWHGADGQVFAEEERELTFHYVRGEDEKDFTIVVDFASQLKSLDGKLTVDGDPQHAGFQFRASEEVAEKTAKQTYYVRPDGTDKPGATRQGAKQPWNAMSFVVGGQRYTCCYLDSPANPKPGIYSERDYGRFGSYFVAEAEGDETIDVRYRLWIQPGEMDVAAVEAQAKNFVEPP